MKQLLNTNLFIGTLDDYNGLHSQGWAVVHATQSVHYKIFGWNRTTNKPNKSHSNYIFYEKDDKLSLNWVDGNANLYEWSGVETFNKILDFVGKWEPQIKVLIHCDQGQSRSPTLGLLYLAKRLKIIPNNSFDEAKNKFIEIYPDYNPAGIADYVNSHWNEIR